MYDDGILTAYKLTNIATAGSMPTEKLVSISQAYFGIENIGLNRTYLALGAKQKIDMLVSCDYYDFPTDAEYVVIDGEQYRITLKQKRGESYILTLERLEDYYDVASAETSEATE